MNTYQNFMSTPHLRAANGRRAVTCHRHQYTVTLSTPYTKLEPLRTVHYQYNSPCSAWDSTFASDIFGNLQSEQRHSTLLSFPPTDVVDTKHIYRLHSELFKFDQEKYIARNSRALHDQCDSNTLWLALQDCSVRSRKMFPGCWKQAASAKRNSSLFK